MFDFHVFVSLILRHSAHAVKVNWRGTFVNIGLVTLCHSVQFDFYQRLDIAVLIYVLFMKEAVLLRGRFWEFMLIAWYG